MDKDLLQKAKDLHATGLSYAEIGRRIGRGRHTIRRWLDPSAEEDNKQRMIAYKKTMEYRLSLSRSMAKKVGGTACNTASEDIPIRPKACEICGRLGKLVFDHCHATGKFRGWICQQCNSALGLVGDSPDLVTNWSIRAVSYLRR